MLLMNKTTRNSKDPIKQIIIITTIKNKGWMTGCVMSKTILSLNIKLNKNVPSLKKIKYVISKLNSMYSS